MLCYRISNLIALVSTVIVFACAPATSQTKSNRTSMDLGSHCSFIHTPAELAQLNLRCSVSNRLTAAFRATAKPNWKECALYTFCLSREGAVHSVQVYRSAGDKCFDEFAVQKIQDSGPYNGLDLSPKFFKLENLKLVVLFPSLQVCQFNQ